MKNLKRRIGKKIRDRRIELGFENQTALAKEMGIDTSRISRWETGESFPKGENKRKLLEALKVGESFLDAEIEPQVPQRESPKTVGEMTADEFTQIMDNKQASLALIEEAIKNLKTTIPANNMRMEIIARELNLDPDSPADQDVFNKLYPALHAIKNIPADILLMMSQQNEAYFKSVRSVLLKKSEKKTDKKLVRKKG